MSGALPPPGHKVQWYEMNITSHWIVIMCKNTKCVETQHYTVMR